MATDAEPSLSNIQAMKDTFIKKVQQESFKHTYDFIVYTGKLDYNENLSKEKTDVSILEIDSGHENGNVYKIECNQPESIYKTYEKTIDTLHTINHSDFFSDILYDWYIRINISAWLNIKLIDELINQLDQNIVYCNAINSIISDEKYLNDLYPRGDFLLFSRIVCTGILQNAYLFYECDKVLEDRIEVTHVDDCLIGLSLIEYFGKDYYKHLKMLIYNYLPQNYKTKEKTEIKRNAVCSRVKTVPPGERNSGYSWKDNEWRRYDKEKMIQLNNIYKNVDYSNVNISDVLVDEKTGRPTIVVIMREMTVDKFYNILNQKRK